MGEEFGDICVSCCGAGNIVGVWVAGWKVVVVVGYVCMFEVRYGFDVFVTLLVLIKLCSVIAS